MNRCDANAMMLRKGCSHTFQAQNHSLLGHVVEKEVMVVVAHRGEKEIRSREDAKQ